jgi:hypothetical protein
MIFSLDSVEVLLEAQEGLSNAGNLAWFRGGGQCPEVAPEVNSS